MSISTFLNGEAPTRLRGLQFLALSDLGDVLTRVYTDDTGGGASQTWGTAGTAIPCRIDPLTGASRITGGRIDERSTHKVTVPAGVFYLVDAQDRFRITGRGTFEVTATRERTAEQTVVFEVLKVT